MGFIGDIVSAPFDVLSSVGSGLEGVFEDVSGKTAAEAAEAGVVQQTAATTEAIAEQRAAAERGQQFLAPFAQIGRDVLPQAGFLTDPQAQFEFLQQNPLFQLSLDEAQRQTQQSAAAGGRLSAGDTLQRLAQNVLTSAQPLIGQQQQNIAGLLDFGRGLATTQAGIETGTAQQVSPLLQDIGNIRSAGRVGAATAEAAGTQNLIQTAGLLFSDERLKENIKPKGRKNGSEWFSWTWNKLAMDLFGLEGISNGVIAQNVIKTHPGSVIMDRGYMKVNYTALGV